MPILYKYFLLLPAVCCLVASAGAQDLHFSQPYMNPLAVNPALTGVFEGPWRAMAAYRDQWSSVPVAYRSITAGADAKLWKKDRQMASGGLLLAHDKAGDLGLRWFQAGISGAYTRALGNSHALSAGAGIALLQRSVDYSDLRVKNQWDGELYNSALPTREFLASATGTSMSLSAGLNWRVQAQGTRSRLDVGFAGSHLNRPELSFEDNAPFELPVRWTAALNGALQVGASTDLVGYGLWQGMQKAGETLAGAGVRQVITTGAGNYTAIQLSVGLRAGDALIPAVQIERNDWIFGFSYDVNTSDFDVATNKRGGVELALMYRMLPVPPVKTFKACPIF